MLASYHPFVWQDGVDNSGASKDKLYSKPEDVFKAGRGTSGSPTKTMENKGFGLFWLSKKVNFGG